MKGLASDNHSGVHKDILKALSDCNKDHEASYGTDSYSEALGKKIKQIFGPDFHWFHCFNGTAANVLGLSALVKSYETVFCTDISHLNVDECAAPEKFLGAKLKTVPHENGKIKLSKIKKNLTRYGDQHFSQPKALSITQPTELGTCYSLDEIQSIATFCKENNLRLHIDGARLSNAAYFLETSLKTICLHADAVSFGGTKNGLLGGELILIKKQHASGFKFIRKQAMQLPSKTRFSSSQFLAYFNDDLHLKIAKHSCEMAKLLNEKINEIEGVKVNYPSQSNAVFVNLPKKVIKPLRKKYFFYVWDDQTFEVRLMTSFDTKKTEINDFTKTLKELLKQNE